ncbi:MAG: hypothetical protein QOI20_1640 [Acidimicrobiaceae bacterium]|nr:hypothetical protein [Acidimicrobiaceae bacterium]
MAVTPRSLRRHLHRNPGMIRVAAGILAGAVGMTTAAYGVLFIVQPFDGNGARSAPRSGGAEPSSPQQDLVAAVLGLVPSDGGVQAPSTDDLLFAMPITGDLVASVVDTLNPSSNGSNGVYPGGPEQPKPLLPGIGVQPPKGGGGEGSKGLIVPNVNVTPPSGLVPSVDGVSALCPALPPALDPGVGREPQPTAVGSAQPAWASSKTQPADDSASKSAAQSDAAAGTDQSAQDDQQPAEGHSSCTPAPTQATATA